MVSESDTPRLVLASGSPRRRLLLSIAGYEFDIVPPDIEESQNSGEPAEDFVTRMATEKAVAVAADQAEGTVVLALDTIVVRDGSILGKPVDEAEAASMLVSLSGRTHTVLTAHCLAIAGIGVSDSGIDAARVTLRTVSRAEAEQYAATGEPLDKAGAYALQGRGGGFVTGVEGLRSTVIGLPLEHVVDVLTRHGIMPTRPVSESNEL
jgi:septum formation protein